MWNGLKVACALLLALGSSCADSAPAAKVARIVAFGDSYADDGNIFRMFGVAPPAIYPKGRFSDGTNFVDTMGALLHAPIVNFALGGAVTGPGRDNRPAGFDTEVRAFLTGGGGAFPRSERRFRAGDLVVVSIGGNDARRFEKTFGAAPSPARLAQGIAAAPAAADSSVMAATAGLRALVEAGATNILFLGGDVGRLPEVKGQSIGRIGSAFSTRYNDGMRAALARFASGGVKTHYLDLDALGDRVERDPAAFGLASAGACPAACVGDRALARRYLFYVDKLHFTAAGYAIIGRAAVAQLGVER